MGVLPGRHAPARVGLLEGNGWMGRGRTRLRSRPGGISTRRRCSRSSSGWRDRRRPSRVWRERSMAARSRSDVPRSWRSSWSCAACSLRHEATTRSFISGSRAAHARQAAHRRLHDDAAGAARGFGAGLGTRPTEFDADRLHAKPAFVSMTAVPQLRCVMAGLLWGSLRPPSRADPGSCASDGSRSPRVTITDRHHGTRRLAVLRGRQRA